MANTVSKGVRHGDIDASEYHGEAAGTSGWVGWIGFGSFMMMLLGSFHLLAGLVAIFNDEWFVVNSNQLLLVDVSAWGWVHLIAGFVVMMAGLSLLSGSMWARTLAVLLAGGSLIANLVSITLYPIWSVIAISMAIMVIYAVIVHGGELRE